MILFHIHVSHGDIHNIYSSFTQDGGEKNTILCTFEMVLMILKGATEPGNYQSRTIDTGNNAGPSEEKREMSN